MTAEPRCKARRWSDEMVCVDCRLRWDANDPDPPKCNPLQPSTRIPLIRPAKKKA